MVSKHLVSSFPWKSPATPFCETSQSRPVVMSCAVTFVLLLAMTTKPCDATVFRSPS